MLNMWKYFEKRSKDFFVHPVQTLIFTQMTLRERHFLCATIWDNNQFRQVALGIFPSMYNISYQQKA